MFNLKALGKQAHGVWQGLVHEGRNTVSEIGTGLDFINRSVSGNPSERAAQQALNKQVFDYIKSNPKIVAEAWDLEALDAAYRAFIDRFAVLRPNSPEAVFAAQTLLVHQWRKFPFLDPDLPERLLPAGWPRRRALAVFRERHAQWEETARDYFASLEAVRKAA